MSTVSRPAMEISFDNLDSLVGDLIANAVDKPPVIPKKEIQDTASVSSRLKKRKAVVEAKEIDTFSNMIVDDVKKKFLALASSAFGTVETQVESLGDASKRLKSEVARVKKDAREDKASWEKEKEVFEKKITDLAGEIADLKQGIASIQDANLQEMDEIKTYLTKSAAKRMVEIKIRMIQEFQEGKHETWDLEREREPS